MPSSGCRRPDPAVTYYLVKVLVSAVIMVLVSEIAKRSSLFGGLLASLPLAAAAARAPLE